MKFIIVAPSFDQNSGGAIVLHKFCSCLSEIGMNAYVTPYPLYYPFRNRIIKNGYVKACLGLIRHKFKAVYGKITYKSAFDNKLFKGSIDESDIVVYPEIIEENPLKAKNVVRWLLHSPDYFTGRISIGNEDLVVPYNSTVDVSKIKGKFTISDNPLTIVHLPLDLYKSGRSRDDERVGACFLVRKGIGKPFVHDDDAIQIDDMSHSEVAKVFEKSKVFYSYDPNTLFSRLAVISGCRSLVIPNERVPKDAWRPVDSALRNGVAYGLDEYNQGIDLLTANKVIDDLREEENNNFIQCQNFVDEVIQKFGVPRFE
ncbi:hypothetical protein [Vibrio breoganii]|uniref:hypothetical protein n=1 Tax=Vibrio breoganii TaxID=553239 RepID=UPI000C84C276|nr:hypothetical protein [Vibrio breoganii]PMG83492.1 hypothetical protein BCU81_15020 [Vibrio breoganii]